MNMNKQNTPGGSLSRRNFLRSGLGLGLFAATGYALSGMSMRSSQAAEPAMKFEITKTPAEWKKLLTPMQYSVLREHDTERPHTSPLLEEKRKGIFHCAGCDLPVYDSAAKYESGTGWPSFFQSLDNAIGTQPDNSFFSERTEVHCRRCGGHFGHIFDDGPAPTGKRHCLNGVSLTFKLA